MKHIYLLVFIALLTSGCRREALIEVEHFPHKSGFLDGTYRSIDGVYAYLNNLKDTYPQNLSLYQLATISAKGRPLPLARINFGGEKQAVKYLFVAGTHGDEAIAVESLLAAIHHFIQDSVRSNHADQNIIFDFILLHNPDGYAENERENANGINLNRDFPFAIQDRELQPETIALISLVNEQRYSASLYFHSANEAKYENMIRCPVEFRKYGLTAIIEPARSNLVKMGENIIVRMNEQSTDRPWQMSTGQVDAGGIASDWCVSGLLLPEYMDLASLPCRHPHPSLTIELCYPKQPQDPEKIDQEKQEMRRIISTFLN